MPITDTDDHRLALLRDDFELLRTHGVRRLMADLELLGEALIALDHGKPHIALDHVDRVRDALCEELAYLRAARPSH